MDEVKLRSELLALSTTMQLLVAMLSNKGLIDLNDMHQKLTDTLISTLQKPEHESELARQFEVAAIDSLDRLFSHATRTATTLRNAAP